jgi:hypothetical protein
MSGFYKVPDCSKSFIYSPIITISTAKPTAAEQLPLYMGKVLPDTRCYQVHQFLPVSARIVHQSYVALYDVTSSTWDVELWPWSGNQSEEQKECED